MKYKKRGDEFKKLDLLVLENVKLKSVILI